MQPDKAGRYHFPRRVSPLVRVAHAQGFRRDAVAHILLEFPYFFPEVYGVADSLLRVYNKKNAHQCKKDPRNVSFQSGAAVDFIQEKHKQQERRG